MRRSLLVLAALLASGPAFAWSHTGRALVAEDRPLQVSVEVDPVVPNLTSEQVVEELQAIVAAWDAASCGIGVEFVGEVDYADPTDVPDGQLHLTFAPLGDDTYIYSRLGQAPSFEVAFERDDRTYLRAEPGAWVINADVPMAGQAAIDDGTCFFQYSVQMIVGILIGNQLGLGSSTDSAALMGPVTPVCEVKRPTADDAAGLDALYGPWASFVCVNPDAAEPLDGEVVGVVPFEMDCTVVADDQTVVQEASWSFGDGGQGTGTEVVHGYDRSDNYSMVVDIVGEHATCGPFERKAQRFNYVRACTDPHPDFRFERELGLSFRLVNLSDLGTYGCVNEVEWSVFDEDGDRVFQSTAWEPIVELPEDGVFRGVMELIGPGGVTVVEAEVDTQAGSRRTFSMGSGCHTSGAPAGLVGLGLVSLLALFRRRRS